MRHRAVSGPRTAEPADTWRPCFSSTAGTPLLGLDRPAAQNPLRRSLSGAWDRADPLGGRPIPSDVLTELRRSVGTGHRLPSSLAATAGVALGADLTGVRLHTDGAADWLARSVQAEAFTHGQDIYLTRGRYAPQTGDGSRILAHELAHVAQGRAGAVGAAGTIGRADDAAESDADAVAARIAPALRRSAQGVDHEGASSVPTSSPPAAPAPDGGVHRFALRRRIETTSADIAALRGRKKGLSKYTGSKDGLDKISKLLDRHSGLADQRAQITSLTAITALVDKWLKGHAVTASREMVALLEQLSAEATRDLSQAQAQQRYVNDLRAGEQDRRRQRLAHQDTGTPFTQQLTDNMAKKTDWAMQGLTVAPGAPDSRKEQTELIRAAGLTEAEVAAIKFFTSNDFLYINPATANNDSWMQGQLGEMQKMADRGGFGQKISTATAKTEGATHAGMIMQGLAKMEPKKGKVYRGARMSPAEFDETYGSKKQLTYHSFVSSAINPGPAWNYARGGGAMPPRPDQTVSVKCVFEVDDARDIRAISLIKFEEEWLLLPGATFAITKIEDEQDHTPGRPAATAWKVVHLKQIKAPTVPPKPAPSAAAATAGGAPDLSSPAARALTNLAAGKFAVPPGAGGSSGSAMHKLARGDFSTPRGPRR